MAAFIISLDAQLSDGLEGVISERLNETSINLSPFYNWNENIG